MSLGISKREFNLLNPTIFIFVYYFSIFNCFLGERIKVETHIENSSSRALKLKFKLEQKQTFIAESRQNRETKVIFKATEDPIQSRSKKTFTSRLKIPSNLDITIPDCNIIKVEYVLKVIVLLDCPNGTNMLKYVLPHFMHFSYF